MPAGNAGRDGYVGRSIYKLGNPCRRAGGRNIFIKATKIYNMRSILYLIAVILVIGWLLGFFVYSASGLIHILIILAVISLLLGLIRRT